MGYDNDRLPVISLSNSLVKNILKCLPGLFVTLCYCQQNVEHRSTYELNIKKKKKALLWVYFLFGNNKEGMRMGRTAQNLCFNKKLCQIVFILIREFKQLA